MGTGSRRALTRRDMMHLASWAALTASLPMPARAAGYPDRVTHVTIGFPAGGGGDILCRYFAHQLELLAGQPFIIDNRPGATGNIAVRYVSRAEPDGYNLLMVASANMVGSRYLFKDLAFDTLKDFRPIASFAQIAFVLVVGPNSPVNSVAELVAKLKAKKDNINGYTSQTAQLSGELFSQLSGAPSRSVAYKTVADAMKDITDGSLDFMILDGTFAAGQVKQGALKALALTTATRSPSFPGVPTLQEAGLAGFDFAPWWGLYAPAKTPDEAAGKLEGWMHQIAKMPETVKFLETVGAIVNDDTASQVDARLRAEMPIWEKLVKAAGIEPQ